jgi:hypothetical protein
MYKKRGQVTVFIILGIVILIFLVGFLVLRSYLTQMKEEGPQPVKDIRGYIESCLKQNIDEGVFTLGMQGGYIELPKEVDFSTVQKVDFGSGVPYWYYNKRSYIPSREEMERQLGIYIERQLDYCLDNFSSFSYKYDVDITGDLNLDVAIGQDYLIFSVNYPMTIHVKGSDDYYTYDEEYLEKKKNSLGRRYDLAKSIMQLENREAFLENYTDEMIACSDWLPYEGMDFGCEPERWDVDEMKEYVQTMIMHNLHFLQFENTDYRETGLPYYDKQYKVRATNDNYDDMGVEVFYNPSWDMEFSVHPSKNGVVKPIENRIRKYLLDCIKVYHHKYSLDYPVLVKILDNDEPDFPFFFATPVHVKRNMPNRKGEIEDWPTEIDRMGSEEFCAPVRTTTRYVSSPSGTPGEYNITAIPNTRVRQHTNKLRVTVVDDEKGYPLGALSGVKIEYHCVKFLCDMGNTSYPLNRAGEYYGALPSLETEFPDCVNGVIIASAPGYHTARVKKTVDETSNNDQVTVRMTRLEPLLYTVTVVENQNGLLRERALNDDEVVMIEIRNEEKDFEETIIYPTDEEAFKNLSLLAGDVQYELDMKLVEDNRLVGGALLNFTTTTADINYARYVVFYVYRKGTRTVTDPEVQWQDYQYALNKSVSFPPRIR